MGPSETRVSRECGVKTLRWVRQTWISQPLRSIDGRRFSSPAGTTVRKTKLSHNQARRAHGPAQRTTAPKDCPEPTHHDQPADLQAFTPARPRATA